MKKAVIVFSLFLLFGMNALASLDSVGVFHRPDRVVVLINENNRSSRLSHMMDIFGVDDSLSVLSADGSVKIECGRNVNAASCTFRFLPSSYVAIGSKNVEVALSVETLKLPVLADYQMSFESSMKDQFVMIIADNTIFISAMKR